MPDNLWSDAHIIDTSNDASGLDEALLQRFEVFPFSAGPTFAEACQERLAWIWQQEAGPGVPMPLGMEQMGWRNGNYSMRRAMTALGGALELLAAVVGAVPVGCKAGEVQYFAHEPPA
jgi:hypothetical protein